MLKVLKKMTKYEISIFSIINEQRIFTQISTFINLIRRNLSRNLFHLQFYVPHRCIKFRGLVNK